jgi:hypothetical protein
MNARRLLPAALAALILAACGSSESSSQSGGPRSWTLAEVLRMSGLRKNADGLTYSLPGHPRCTVRVLLRTSAEVQTYVNSGDPIATNPDKSAGAVVDPTEPASCKQVFTRAFAGVR